MKILNLRAANLKQLGLACCLAVIPPVIGLTGCAGDRYTQSTGEKIDDMGITSRVKKSLGEDPEYKFAKVEVHTFKGTVQLSGWVNTRAEKARAADRAKTAEGAKAVENNISVKE